MGFWSGVGDVVSGIASPITTLGGQWLKNRGDVSKAAADLKIAELKAKTTIAVQRAEMEIKVLEGTQALDYLAVQQQGKSIWDEVMSLAIFAYPGYIAYNAAIHAPPEQVSGVLLLTLHQLPGWYVALIFLVFINYFGYRSLFRVFLKAYGNKINPVSWFRKPNKEIKDDTQSRNQTNPPADKLE